MSIEDEYDKPYGITLNLNRDFVNAWRWNRRKYGEKFEKINGLHNSNLNFTDFIDNFERETTVGDTTIDANANVNSHDAVSLMHEMVKPHQKLLSLNKIYIEMEKKYGKEEANRWFENEYNGAFYLHDASSTSLLPYCYAYDLEDLATKGLFFIASFKTGPAHHLSTFIHHVQEFISWASNRTSGACGLPTFLFHSYGFWMRDVQNGYFTKDPETYRRQAFQEFIYALNQPYLRVVQSAFTNISIFDREYLTEIFGARKLPNGDYGIDHIEDLIEHQKVFMDVVADTRSKNMMTFPVLSYNLLYKDGKFVDEEMARWCSDHNAKWYDSNFMNSSTIDAISNCCFDANQQVLIRTSNLGSRMMSIKEFYDMPYRNQKDNTKVFHNGSWVKAKCIRLDGRREYKVTTANGKSFVATDNHVNVTLGGEKPTEDLTTDDYIAFNTRELDAVKEVEHHLTYEQGFLLGLYAGDGSQGRGEFQDNRGCNNITLSLNESNYADIETVGRAICQIDGNDVNIRTTTLGKLVTVSFCSRPVYDFIFTYLHGTHANTKEFDMSILSESKSFRRGIIDGWYASDGGNNNRIYSVSRKLIETGDAIFTSLGMNTTIDVVDRTGEIEIKGETFNRNFPLWCIRWYESTNRRVLKDVYVVKNNTMYFKIRSIEPFEPSDGYCYCFEMDNENEPYFTLPNGIITHNCRLVSSTKHVEDGKNKKQKLTGFINSIGGTALSIGSVKVNTINMRRIALESMGEDGAPEQEKFFAILKKRTKRCCEVLDVIRGIIKGNVKKGFLPNYTYGLIDFDKQYSTIGVTAIYEVVKDFGLIRTDEFGNNFYTDEAVEFVKRIFETINEVKDSFDVDYTFNIENVPGESANKKLYQKDFLLYGEVKAGARQLYANQWIALTDKCTIDEKIRTAAILDPLCSGGQIAHINLESPISEKQHWKLLNKIAKAGCQYFAFNPKISVCKNGHGFFGDTCPECGEPKADTFSRIVGYLVPTSNFEKTRKAEFNERQWFDLNEKM